MSAHLRAIVSFAAVAQERSFTRAAEKLGVTQPWVSEQLRRLEEHVGFPLVVRSTRRLELTNEGAQLLPLAIRLARDSEEAEACIRALQQELGSRLKIGTVAETADIAERNALIEDFIAKYALVAVEVVEDSVPNLVERLRTRELDIVIGFDFSHVDRGTFDVLPIVELESYLLLPAEDRAAKEEKIPRALLNGRTIVTSPHRLDPGLFASLEAALDGLDVRLVSAHESNRRAVERFARVRRFSVFRWRRKNLRRRMVGDMVLAPLVEPMRISLLAIRNPDLPSRNVERFWRMAQAIEAAAEPAEA